MTHKVVDDLMRTYFKVGREFNIFTNTLDISEFLRYTLCLALNLKTTSEYTGCEQEVDILVSEFNKVLIDNKFPKRATKKYKQGILEACVHCIEISRKNVEKN